MAGDLSQMAGDLFPMAGNLSPMAGDLSPMAGDLSPMAGDLSTMAGDLSPMAGDLSPMAGGRSPMAGGRSPKAGDLSPMAGDLSPMGGENAFARGASRRECRDGASIVMGAIWLAGLCPSPQQLLRLRVAPAAPAAGGSFQICGIQRRDFLVNSKSSMSKAEATLQMVL